MRRLDDAKERNCSETLYDPALIARSRCNTCRVFTPLLGGTTIHNAGKRTAIQPFFPTFFPARHLHALHRSVLKGVYKSWHVFSPSSGFCFSTRKENWIG